MPQFQVRGKWVAKKDPLEINDVVIIKDECMPPTRWKTGREYSSGADGVVRVVTVRSEMKSCKIMCFIHG